MKKKTRTKKIIRRLLILLVLLILIVGGYLAYAFLTYYRLPDKLTLEVEKNGKPSAFDEEKAIKLDEYYEIMTYNIGFGAYRPEFSFFMDGGKYSWGKDKETIMASICGVGEIINNVDPDIVLVQEVDLDGTRSYHVDELELLNQFVTGYYYAFAQNYDSPFLFYPLLQPHGKNLAGMITYSKKEITDAMRRSLPISESFSKMVDLDRCYSVSRIPVEDGEKSLCIYNIHSSAYGSNAEIREGQIAMLKEDMEAEYKKGNYVICGGDFNHNLKKDEEGVAPEWAYPFPAEELPSGFHMAIDDAKEENIQHNSCRDANEPYQEGHTYTVTVDGFIVSDNVTVNYYANLDWQYEYSDHDPVVMQFRLNRP